MAVGTLVDLIGRTFERLCVTKRGPNDKRGRPQWHCRCVCGTEIVKSANILLSGHVRSCGCLRRETTSARGKMVAKDMTGQIFDRLTVLRRADSNIRRSAAWVCLCECGQEKNVASTDLREGQVRSCGCLRVDDLTGQVFGRLTVSERDRAGSAPGKVRWFCICECGNRVSVAGGELRVGGTKSCGCLKREHLVVPLVPGAIHGWFTVVDRRGSNKQGATWLVKCKCGAERVRTGRDIRTGRVVSCGCARQGVKGAALRPAAINAKGTERLHARRARLKGAGGFFTADQVDALYATQKGRCAEPSCRIKLDGKFHRDHIMPVTLGGAGGIENIQLLCQPCNNRKRAKHPIAWAQENGRLL